MSLPYFECQFFFFVQNSLKSNEVVLRVVNTAYLVHLLLNVKVFQYSGHQSIRPYQVFQQQALEQAYCSLYNRLEQTLLRRN